ncbi:hypothetical protein K435DRAFT_756739 [Dendrothele bispora CBS 962.96]|uniref:Protein kinase domain-containing protein n=1 Tax=Dendrothele bispora (strain CBS 962.96) TaxID=1314807 RepID=A0A4S8LYF9_DENBC|nr:hypothetical protein K435DRAFT_756739 [Dendrothele bispora CBS 962.96]
MAEPGFSGDLTDSESYWKDHYSWLGEKGYQLRPRYRPDWKPSWNAKKAYNPLKFEDAQRGKEAYHLMDATRKSDGLVVLIKKIEVNDPANPTREIRMNRLLCSGLFSVDDPQNHCIPVYEILQLPENNKEHLLVMPFLEPWWPNWQEVPFSTIGEAITFMRQVFEGVRLLHSHNIAHNDIKHDNIMVDSAPIHNHPIHPSVPERRYDWSGYTTRKSLTRNPVKYYTIDFGSTLQYDPQNGPAREEPGYGGDRALPEFENHPNDPCDPYAVEVFRLGNLVRRFLMTNQRVWKPEEVKDLKVNHAMDFMSDLVADMTQEDPSKRPSMDQVVRRFDEIVKGLSFVKLRSRFWPGFKNESFLARTLWIIPRHFVSQAINVLGRYPAIPPTPGPPKGKKRK